jgi:heterodisulfide reductase subunit A
MKRVENPADEKIGVYVCHCGSNIADTIDIDQVTSFAERLDGVSVVRESGFLCGQSGQQMICNDIDANDLTRVVVAACSPLLHESTFREAIQDHGLNAFNLQMANIREQVSWVTRDHQEATRKATALVAAAVSRVSHHQALHVDQYPVSQTVLVVGAGVAGIEAALRLADADKKVILVEREPYIGGHVSMLDRTFPTMDCSACILVPKVARAAHHKSITLRTFSEVEEVGGHVGNFKVRIRRKPRYIDEELCTGCGVCVDKCPIDYIPSEFEQGLDTRSAVYFPFAQAVPDLPLIDPTHCGHHCSSETPTCEAVCPTDAVVFDQQNRYEEIEVGAIIVTTGFQLFDPVQAPEYGYGRWPNILTSLQFERLCHPSGPTGGKIVMDDGREPKSIAFLHCVGSRSARYNRHCSRICCMTSLKFAMEAKRKTDADVFSFYIDIRAAGKNCEEFFEQTQKTGVVFVHGKGTEVIFRGGHLLIKAEDASIGRRIIVPVDLVVLAVGIEPQEDSTEVAKRFGIGCNERGFFTEKHVKLAPVETTVQGIFVAGACQGPRDIPDSVAQGAAAAASVLGLIEKGVVEIEPTVARVDQEHCSGCLLCTSSCPYQAIDTVEVKGRQVAEITKILCKSCGGCVAVCPSLAIDQLGFSRIQLEAELRGLLSVSR